MSKNPDPSTFERVIWIASALSAYCHVWIYAGGGIFLLPLHPCIQSRCRACIGKMTEDNMSLSLVLSYKKSRKTVKGKPKSTFIHFKLLNDIALPPSYPRDLGSLLTTEIIFSINRFPAKILNETEASISGGKTFKLFHEQLFYLFF